MVAQSGRYPATAADDTQVAFNKQPFFVDGEQRCWIHVAIDRLTGEIIDKQVEVVTE